MRTLLSVSLFVLMLGLAGAVAWTHLPCAMPVPLTVGRIDPDFHLSADDLQGVMVEAVDQWEGVIGRPLFLFDPIRGIPVNVIYDSRQQTVDQLKVIDASIKETEDRRQVVLDQYNQLRAQYDQLGTSFKNDLAAYNEKQSAYSAEVKGVSSLTPEQRDDLVRRGAALDQEYRTIINRQAKLSDLAGQINALVAEDQALVPVENSQINEFNDTAGANGSEYEAGLYSSGPDGVSIDLYLYQSHDQLLRLLTHELGHALGLDHVEDEQALMYRLNVSKTPKLTDADRAAIEALCRQGDPWQWPSLLLEWWNGVGNQ